MNHSPFFSSVSRRVSRSNRINRVPPEITKSLFHPAKARTPENLGWCGVADLRFHLPDQHGRSLDPVAAAPLQEPALNAHQQTISGQNQKTGEPAVSAECRVLRPCSAFAPR